ncbi:D-alanine--D-alanine ligase [Corynebacterium sp. TAE3-ERU12]|uniref:D-alanine--D-alanine ligase family protein n=1 Tax=Corynebacterium sp. TAE3-ERU12 TaxID=2849491 RepID=UPI001C48A0B9|nr:D-alanine--D-alanine ligase family protein [Corynebacterium sp. TAE3-ERU12]MBV7295188.1 D-alanine--D-alanine ligase [Corynebacterium sp. TAE3-ERU12]
MNTTEAANSMCTVAVLYGGASPEHSVSCISAAAVIAHLDPERYRVVPIGITRTGTWVPGTADPTADADGELPEVPEPTAETERLELAADPGHRGQIRILNGKRTGEIFATADVIFPVLHGPQGEDGTIQGLFELSGVDYVGPGVLASAAGMDKERTKNLVAAAGLPIGDQVVLHEGEELTDEERDRLGLPVFVKPARGGSSIGISKVDSWDELADAMSLAHEHDWKVIVEAAMAGPEVECGVLQRPDGTVIASEPARLCGTEESDEGFYGFDTKYLDNVVTAQIPAKFADDTVEKVQEIAKKAFRALGCDGLSRVDFFITDQGPIINEINTMPGFTPISMYPKMFAATNIGYIALLDTLIERARVARR